MKLVDTKTLFILLVFVLGLVGERPVQAERIEAGLAGNDVVSVDSEGEGLGLYYTVRVNVPASVSARNLQKVFLELAFDVGSRSYDGIGNPAPVLEVYALAQSLGQELSIDDLRRPSPMKRSIRAGYNQTVRIDVTPAIRRFLSNPSDNHGLVVGSLTKSRDGLFTLRSSGDTKGRIVYYCAD